MKFKGIILLLAVIFLFGCAHPIANKKEIEAEYNKHWGGSFPPAIWYKGTKDGYHHIKVVYMFGDKKYRLPQEELEIEDTFPPTINSNKWIDVSEAFSSYDPLILDGKIPGIGLQNESFQVSWMTCNVNDDARFLNNFKGMDEYPGEIRLEPTYEEIKIHIGGNKWVEVNETYEQDGLWYGVTKDGKEHEFTIFKVPTLFSISNITIVPEQTIK